MLPFLLFFSSASVRENGLACASSYRVFSLDRRIASRRALSFFRFYLSVSSSLSFFVICRRGRAGRAVVCRALLPEEAINARGPVIVVHER